jgi:hypothetical protein
MNSLEGFLDGRGSAASPEAARHHASNSWRPDLPGRRSTRLPREQPSPGSAYLSVSPRRWPSTGGVGRPRRAFLSTPDSAGSRIERYRNINLLSIDYASRPRLRTRLTLGGRTFPRNPWTSGGGDSHSSFATHADILTHVGLHNWLTPLLRRPHDAPLPIPT